MRGKRLLTRLHLNLCQPELSRMETYRQEGGQADE